ncbi:HIT domain-containing protein [Microbacterium profundi]|uniref:HIT domain-containing protein n=1 Tax=Microbacterium profundi TaxID=450380 RepID=A0ABV3LE27_9MICO
MSHPHESSAECLFCDIDAGVVPYAKVMEDATTLAFMDIDPGSDGHLLVIPKRHSADLLEISPEDSAVTTLTVDGDAIAARALILAAAL